MNNKECVTISGGFDSGCLPFIIKDTINIDFIFFNYNQGYLKKELQKAEKLAGIFNKKLIILTIPEMKHDQERRNFLFLSELKKLQYTSVTMGNRNILPIFDKYRDSNFLELKIFAYFLNLKLSLPITGWSKNKVFYFLQNEANYFDFYNCYNNEDDYNTCSCVNCFERRELNKKKIHF